MYLIDTNIISEIRKGNKANPGVRQFFDAAIQDNAPLYISAITIGELRRGVDLIFHRGDASQGKLLEDWLNTLLDEYQNNILSIDGEIALLWGKLRVPEPEHALDKLIAATGIIYDLTVVTRNTKDFNNTGVRLLNPFTE
ncbi:MAG: type II toxin-antitoxin system VapC family toxin [Methylococcaceae bacterium]|nr:type II toxin-antitoxin system VapC family toxin [Methylococcaceae bacterium]MDZ4155618.1 type II toxin-antitoxin system VapC family toxin [Methylococcales bacterium]MDP2392246.1 type II toxin-antitoxin system VapC family toxin [Methylococcaceae bacterium]MDP3018248.1 type II toxin-antitoxin system VapC family toxin [Methylococcaceae bacterium]MDP3389891.1 type II toxin-antitoxin system VapC family toxin [Methylococcaceae bacterium]